MSCYIERSNAATIEPDRAREMSDRALVLAVDPGDYGMAAYRKRSGQVSFCSPLIWDDVLAVVRARGSAVVLAEDQFLKFNPGTSQELTWQTASLVGFLAGFLSSLHVVHVKPRVWQAEQMSRMGIPVRKQLDRKEGIKLANQELREKIPAITLASLDQKSIEGCASAIGILLWWEGLCAR